MRRFRKWLPLVVVLVLFAVFAASGGLHAVNARRAIAAYGDLRAAVSHNPLGALGLFILVYAALASLVLFPAAFVLTMTGGLMFGTLLGASASVLGVTLGGTVSFLAVRTAFADEVQRLMGARGERFRAALEQDGFVYLAILRTSPVPFWITTLAASAAGFRLRPYVLATFLGVIPPCLVWANVGAGLAEALDAGREPSLAMIGDKSVLIPLTALSAFGVISTFVRRWLQRRARAAVLQEP